MRYDKMNILSNMIDENPLVFVFFMGLISLVGSLILFLLSDSLYDCDSQSGFTRLQCISDQGFDMMIVATVIIVSTIITSAIIGYKKNPQYFKEIDSE
jgi:hypothetical protein